MSEQSVIEVAVALLMDPEKRLVLVRKQGTFSFMQPGGKINAGEQPTAALIRELSEELGLSLSASRLISRGVFENLAANEPGWKLRAHLFEVSLQEYEVPVVPNAEIAELAIVDSNNLSTYDLAPLTRDQVVPLWREALKLF
jgi:8-oxo-dGTP pyrophosphatase MutT (NUDIX family)